MRTRWGSISSWDNGFETRKLQFETRSIEPRKHGGMGGEGRGRREEAGAGVKTGLHIVQS